MGMVDGAPTGMQIVARRHEDALALAAAAAFERAHPWPLLAPDRRWRSHVARPPRRRAPGPRRADHGGQRRDAHLRGARRAQQPARPPVRGRRPRLRRPRRLLPREPPALPRDPVGGAAVGPLLHRDQLAAHRRRGGLPPRRLRRRRCSSRRGPRPRWPRQLLDRMPNVTTRLMLDGAIDGYDAYEDAVAAFPATPIAEELEGAAMLYSSGTTGRPKGIRYALEREPIGSAPFAVDMFKAVYGIDRDDVFLSPAPMYHSAPLQFAHDAHPHRRHRRGDGALRRRGGAGRHRALRRHPRPVGADDVRPHAQAARRGARRATTCRRSAAPSTPPPPARSR